MQIKIFAHFLRFQDYLCLRFGSSPELWLATSNSQINKGHGGFCSCHWAVCFATANSQIIKRQGGCCSCHWAVCLATGNSQINKGQGGCCPVGGSVHVNTAGEMELWRTLPVYSFVSQHSLAWREGVGVERCSKVKRGKFQPLCISVPWVRSERLHVCKWETIWDTTPGLDPLENGELKSHVRTRNSIRKEFV